MHTRASLLLRIRDPKDALAWAEFVRLYAPLLHAYGVRHGLQDADAADLAQDTLRNVLRAAPEFVYDPARGSFRGWLYAIARNEIRKAAARANGRVATGDPAVRQMLAAVPDPASDRDEWDREYRLHLFHWAAGRVRPEFREATWQAFWRTAVGGEDVADPVATLGGRGGKLTVRDCRVVCGRGAGCVLSEAPELAIERCHLVAEASVAVLWRSAPGGRLRVTGSAIEARSAVWVSFPEADGPGREPGAVELTDNTVAAEGMCAFVYRGLPKGAVRVTARRNVFRVDSLFGVPTRLGSASGAPEALRAVVAGWAEADNVYDRKCTYLVAIKVSNPSGVFPTRLTGLGDWVAFWKAKDTGSVEGEIQFHPRVKGDLPAPLRLHWVENATGEVPNPVGAGELPFR